MTKEQFENLLKSIIDSNEGLTQEAIAKELGYNEGYISQMTSRGKVSDKFVRQMTMRFAKGKDQKASKKQAGEGINNEPDLGKAIQDLIAVTKEQAETTRIQAEVADKHAAARIQEAAARMQEAENVSRLISLTERNHGITGGADEQSKADLYARCEDLLVVMADIATGKKYSDWNAAHEGLRKRFYEHVAPETVEQ